MRKFFLLSMVGLLLLSSGCENDISNNSITVLAAASTSDLVMEIADKFEDETGISVAMNFASSGVLSQQIISGANADVFISANIQWMDALAEQGFVDGSQIQTMAKNQLVVIAHKDDNITLNNFPAIVDYAQDGIAIGDPEHVPAGIYARQAMESAGIWDQLKLNLLRALDVRAALAYVKNREARVGIVYRSDATIEPDVKIILAVSKEMHSAILYPVAPLKTANLEHAKSFISFLTDSDQDELYNRKGFTIYK